MKTYVFLCPQVFCVRLEVPSNLTTIDNEQAAL